MQRREKENTFSHFSYMRARQLCDSLVNFCVSFQKPLAEIVFSLYVQPYVAF